jgi:DNA end-binding protein Ku
MTGAAMAGIGRIVLRTREHLAAIRPKDDVLVLETLYHADEIRDPAEVLRASSQEISERELGIATQLIEMLRTDWDPSRYTDGERKRVLEAIAAKAEKGTVATDPDVVSAPDVPDLMAALRASVEAAKARLEHGKQAG